MLRKTLRMVGIITINKPIPRVLFRLGITTWLATHQAPIKQQMRKVTQMEDNRRGHPGEDAHRIETRKEADAVEVRITRTAKVARDQGAKGLASVKVVRAVMATVRGIASVIKRAESSADSSEEKTDRKEDKQEDRQEDDQEDSNAGR